MPAKFVDPYIDPDTGILKNLVGATTYDQLRNAEGELVAPRISEVVEKHDLYAAGSLDDFCTIHYKLFQDVYAWAGQVRTVEIRKNLDDAEFFLPSPSIPMGFLWAQGELENDGMLKGLELECFAERLAYHYDNYNFIHPFREGNGRTQRLFWTLVCHDAGYDLDWCKVDGGENDEASRLAAEDRDYSKLIGIFGRIAQPCDPDTPLKSDFVKAIRFNS